MIIFIIIIIKIIIMIKIEIMFKFISQAIFNISFTLFTLFTLFTFTLNALREIFVLLTDGAIFTAYTFTNTRTESRFCNYFLCRS